MLVVLLLSTTYKHVACVYDSVSCVTRANIRDYNVKLAGKPAEYTQARTWSLPRRCMLQSKRPRAVSQCSRQNRHVRSEFASKLVCWQALVQDFGQLAMTAMQQRDWITCTYACLTGI